ncbi:hotdog fold thioesterase [Rugamonas sp. CCM 8940]|uniref:hotdog fold thioesterase n=1 Tax=Rugamonas sp. CCM 8940 TaxID=2765359 RepID=UPI0018F4E8CF|nr:hotdog fold thioesterase [Rugamonas sp. CCM 8940]MBJ7312893.1 hotdog fold thioesterase [Rugamonas sp. CCM 8940]
MSGIAVEAGTRIWQRELSLDALNQMSANTIQALLGIRIIEIGADYLKASMPVDARSHQPFGILHGGASVVLAETTGSMAATMCLPPQARCVGLEVNANHLRPVASGTIKCVARPVHLGGLTQVWEIRITDQHQRNVCAARLTMLVLPGQPLSAGAAAAPDAPSTQENHS